MDKVAKKSLLGWEPVNSRIIRARFFSKYVKTTIIQCYAPTDEATDEKDFFYNTLQDQIDKTALHDVIIVMGDLNAKVGSDSVGYESCMGREGVGERNDNGRRFADMCLENGLVIGGTIFQHKTIHKLSCISPYGKTSNQIDHIAINQTWRRSLRDVKAIRGADASSDHHLMLGRLLLKLRSTSGRNSEPLYDSRKLRDPVVKNQFVMNSTTGFKFLRIYQQISMLCVTLCRGPSSTPARTY